MTSFGWMLVAHVVVIDTWIRLVVPAAVHPVAALMLLALAVVVAHLVVRAASRAVEFAIVPEPLATWPRPPLPDVSEQRASSSPLLVSGNGPRAPGRTFRRPIVAARPA